MKNKYKILKMLNKTVDNIEKQRYNEVEPKGKKQKERRRIPKVSQVVR